MKRVIALLFFLLFSSISFSQQDEADSTVVLKFDEFYALVLSNHPVVRQAELLTEQAAQELRLARGGFDPKLEGTYNLKNFKDLEYYDKLDLSLKIPVWFPVDPKVGIERNEGEFLNRENNVSSSPNGQQIYAGISLPVGKGLFIDKRRATVKQARLFQEMAEAEQIKEINKILLTVAKDYWNWFYAYNNYLLLQQSIAIAQDIFDRTKVGFEYGEVAAIDTVQAKITLLQRITDFQQANIERGQSSLVLSNHLWSADGAPLELADNVRPEELVTSVFEDTLLTQLVEMARINHPELRKLELKNRSLLVDRSLARENLKPRLDLNYSLLDQPFNSNGESNNLGLTDNYKLGVDLSFPLFLRKERAKLGQTNLKIQDNNFERDFREREIINSINGEYIALVNTGAILDQQQQMVNSYQRIVAAERLNLQNGESDLFKINLQVDKLIESQSKLLKLKSTYQKNVANLYWAAGVTNLGR
ncbi:MAG: TolC family protein [Bacteroidota bacterium]